MFQSLFRTEKAHLSTPAPCTRVDGRPWRTRSRAGLRDLLRHGMGTEAVYEHAEWLVSPNVRPFPAYVVSAANIRNQILPPVT